MSDAERAEAPEQPRHGAHGLGEVALLFLRLGCTAFGGPAAHIAMMEDEVVRRRRWLTREEFLDLLGAANLIPGPNSTELAIHLGHRRGGWPGLLVAGACFILPAMLITLAAAWAYVRFGSLPSAEGVLYGVKPVIIAVVLQALWGLGRAAVKTRLLAAVGVAAVIASALGVNELLVLLCAGVLMALWRWGTRTAGAGQKQQGPGQMMLGMPLALQGLAAGAAGAVPFSLGGLFLFFVKVGAVLFGSGYVLLAFLRADLVERWGWLSEAQLLDAVAVGQVTPGPVFTTATFIGYLLGGSVGAVVATVGIFLPAFFFVAVSGPLVPRLRRSWVAGAVLDGVNVASLALMAVVTWQLGRSALVDAWTVGLALLSAALLLRFRLNSAWLVLGGALTGLLLWTAGA
ncbi:chromate efflux transporter [Myxococcus sp. SDU36]|uniref:chromate efflux transporter n=1 Tax=Myxococcus sp. SDU36 TaxID=2831967 RepID=UPI0025429C78|nr:chromate efflux transporter [Myxococcus sp. SDU36]WIG97923.1 chromate efflux transporter [Myxococcus sp. SDU36]